MSIPCDCPECGGTNDLMMCENGAMMAEIEGMRAAQGLQTFRWLGIAALILIFVACALDSPALKFLTSGWF
jgi:hypothetical protein